MGFAKSFGCTLAAVVLLVVACSRDASRVSGTGIQPPPAPQLTAEEAGTEFAPEPASSPSPGDPDPGIASELAELSASEPPTAELSPAGEALRSHVRDLEFEALQAVPSAENGEAVLISFDEEGEPSLLDELNEATIPNDFSLAESREARLKATRSDLPLVLNSQVIRLVNYFTTGRGRKTFQRTIDRSEAYRPMIERVLEEEDVPPEIFHLAQAESGFRPLAISRARATGMWQFIRATGRQYGLRQNRYVDERYDPENATRAAARHLKDLYLEFGHWYLAMAAYNGGPMRVVRSVKRADSKDYWTLSRRRLLRRETRNYVPIILAMTYVAKNPWLYESIERDPAPPIRYDTTTTNTEIHLNLIADITDASIAQLRELNPALRRSATPPHNYDLRLPEGTVQTFEGEIAHIPKEKRLAWRRHKVKEKETLAAIAKRYRIKSSLIAELNQLGQGELNQGSLLTIPSGPQKIEYYYRGGAGGFLVGGTGRYRIARGDTLGGMAGSVRYLRSAATTVERTHHQPHHRRAIPDREARGPVRDNGSGIQSRWSRQVQSPVGRQPQRDRQAPWRDRDTAKALERAQWQPHHRRQVFGRPIARQRVENPGPDAQCPGPRLGTLQDPYGRQPIHDRPAVRRDGG